VLVNAGLHDRDVAQVVVGAGGERAGCRVVLAEELERLDPLLPDHHVDAVEQEEAAGEPPWSAKLSGPAPSWAGGTPNAGSALFINQ